MNWKCNPTPKNKKLIKNKSFNTIVNLFCQWLFLSLKQSDLKSEHEKHYKGLNWKYMRRVFFHFKRDKKLSSISSSDAKLSQGHFRSIVDPVILAGFVARESQSSCLVTKLEYNNRNVTWTRLLPQLSHRHLRDDLRRRRQQQRQHRSFFIFFFREIWNNLDVVITHTPTTLFENREGLCRARHRATHNWICLSRAATGAACTNCRRCGSG